ncbi:nucleotide-sugar transporter-domain-containing protein, partial [Gymnopilus junonius]
LVTLAVQNAALSIVMHYSRVSIPPSLAYSPASAVLLNELLKGSISFVIALLRSPILQQSHQYQPLTRRKPMNLPMLWLTAFSDLCMEIFSPDCWKLSIPAILYVVQNSLQFVAISNLPVASFQVTYQMKILTTAAFSVVLLRKKLSSVKWLSLFFLAIGVGIVQIQNAASTGPGGGHGGLVNKASATAVGSAHEFHVHVMNPLKGFGAVTAACFTSGLAGVYFEMVLKGSKADLWVRNVQLSLFSLIPALLPILWSSPPPNSRGFVLDMFHNFGWWAWATVAIQVAGGLVTAVVIKYSDNILKGFATSLSIVLSFLASVALFDFRMTPSFVIGASTVLAATWMYNQPAVPSERLPTPASAPASPKEKMFSIVLNDASPTSSGKSSPSLPYYPGTPVGAGGDANGVLGGLGVGSFMRRKSGGFGGAGSSRNSSTASLSALLTASSSSTVNGGSVGGKGELGLAESGELLAPLDSRTSAEGASPFSSKPPSRAPSPAPIAVSVPPLGPGPRRTTSTANMSMTS